MSVNIDVEITVTEPADAAQAERIADALNDVARDEGIHHEISFVVDEWEGRLEVVGGTQYPLIITRFGQWQPEFESRVHSAVQAVAPAAKTDIKWGYPDDEDD
ncbi:MULTISPECIES: hypothetical protein [unclassified Streptomyces]|uniref:hypothetical protein n=1 Tax=unclassified Streptomyces TaxID=2593676 RepID=UPI00380BECA5